MLNLRINGVYNSCVILPHCGGAHAPAQCAWVKCAITNPIRVKREYCRSETFGEQTACSCGEERRENPAGSRGAEVGAKAETRWTTGGITIVACRIELADATQVGDKLGFKLDVL